LGPRISKEKLTNGVIDLVKSSRRSGMKACHLIDQGVQMKRWIKWTKFAIGFKDDETINDHKVINEEQLGRV
jgi:hypothetical protein